MAYEMKTLRYVGLGRTKHEKVEVYDENGYTSFTLSSATYTFIKASDGTSVLSGSANVDNSDTDAEGNTIKTVRVVLDLANVNVSTGYYYLVLTVTFSTGETEDYRIPYQVKDYTGVY